MHIKFIFIGLVFLSACGNSDQLSSNDSSENSSGLEENASQSDTGENGGTTDSNSTVDFSGLNFCETYKTTLENIGGNYPDLVTGLKASQTSVPDDAPDQAKNHLGELVALAEQNSDVNEFFAARSPELEERDFLFEGYMNDRCATTEELERSITIADDLMPDAEVRTEDLLEAGKTVVLDDPSSNLEMEVTRVRATNSEPKYLLADQPIATEQMFLLVDVQYSNPDAAPATPTTYLKLKLPEPVAAIGANNAFFINDEETSAIVVPSNSTATHVLAYRTQFFVENLDEAFLVSENKDGSTELTLSLKPS